MSYILDALKKSEQQRGALNIPSEVTSLPSRTKAGISRFHLVTGLLIVVLIAAWLMTSSRQSSPDISRQESIKQGVISGQEEAGTPAADVSTGQQPGHVQAEKRTTMLSAAMHQQAHPHQTSVEQDRGHNNKPVEQAASVVHDEPVPVFKPIMPNSPVSRGMGPLPEVGDDNAQVAPADADIPSLRELPPTVQQSLPTINIEGHIYDDNPAARMVIVNGKIRREKQAVGNGLTLEEITPDGVILGYQKYIFHMGIFDR